MISRAAVTMVKHTNRLRRPAEVVVGGYAWLSTEHLKLAPGLSCKLAAEFFGPFWVVPAVGAMSFRLELPSLWCVHDVFHALQLRHAVGYDGSNANAAYIPAFCLAADELG